MKYVKYHFSNGYCGCEYDDYWEFEDGYYIDKDIDAFFLDEVTTYGESYEHFIEGDTEEAYDAYYDDCYYNSYWEYVTEEEYRENKNEE